MTTTTRTIISGSARTPVPGAKAVGPVPADQQIEVTVKLRIDPALAAHSDAAAAAVQKPAAASLARQDFARVRGASPADAARVTAFAHAHALVVVHIDLAQRSMVLAGTAGAMAKAFDTELNEYEFDGGTYRGRLGHLTLPSDIADAVQGVFGLDDRPQATPKFQVRRLEPDALASSIQTDYTPTELARQYHFPLGLDGSGQCIGIIELGGGLRPADIKNYFSALGLAQPHVKVISVDHAKNRPTTADSADGEVMLDLEVAGAIAPKATIAVYFAPNTDRGFLDAISNAVHDKVNKPSVISISWGAAEVQWTDQAMEAFEQAFIDAAVMGVTICVAAGDNGSGDGQTDAKPHVDFPSSAPHALGCGGTRLAAGTSGALTETVWNAGPNSATGGGFSTHFAVPAYQTTLAQGWSGRGVPDVAGNADPASGYRILVDGKNMVIGGTSAVAPLWAGLIALLNQALGKPVGFLQPVLYGAMHGTGVTLDITAGSNGAYVAGPGWDPCTGWGSPNGAKLLEQLTRLAAAQ
jgi:kumamolisin